VTSNFNNKGLPIELRIESYNPLTDFVLVFHAHRNSLASVQHCSVIPASEDFPNFMQGCFCVAPGKIHRHLARKCNIRAASLAGHVREPNIKMLGHLLLNLINSNCSFDFFPQNIPKKLFYRLAGTLSANERLVRANPHQGTLQTPNIGSDMLRQKSQNVLAKHHLKCLGPFS
jgi:hypothetical protein